MEKKPLTNREIIERVETEVRYFNTMVWAWHDSMIIDLVATLNLPKEEVEEMVNKALNALPS